MPKDVLWTVKSASLALGVHPETIRRWIRGGQLPATLQGGRRTGYRIATADLDPLFKERVVEKERLEEHASREAGQFEFVESAVPVPIDGGKLPWPELPPGPYATNEDLLAYAQKCLTLAGLAQEELRRRLEAGEGAV